MKVLILGAGGLTGRYLVRECKRRGMEAVAYTKQELDISKADIARDTLAKEKPELVINSASLTSLEICVGIRPEHSLFTLGLIFAISRKRRGQISWQVGSTFLSVKNIVRTQMDKSCPVSTTLLGPLLRRLAVHLAAQNRILLASLQAG